MSPKPRIVVAEDDRDIRDLIRTQLEAAGYDVVTAYTGLEALACIQAARPDAMILDINMPGLDGFAVLEQMREPLSGRRLPVLVLTARHAAGDVRRAVTLGAKDYLTKPFTEQQLMARVGRLLRSQPKVVLV